ncbi:MAG: DUF6261 family protein [Dysgonamonadaceae bacterium]|jgi:hypothetical protein|nr:DUF6261 family protein [Dysgonamonadaceae bacterium]
MRIIKIDFSRLRAEAHYQLFRVVKNLLATYPNVAVTIGQLAPKLLQLIDLEGQLVDIVTTSGYTQQIAHADHLRDADIAGLSAAVKAFLVHYDPDKAEAARVLEIRLKAFHSSITKKTYEEESAAIDVLLHDLQSVYAAQVAMLDLSGWVSRLIISNDRFETLFASRNDEKAHKPQEKLREVRKEIDAVYADASTIINATSISGNSSCDEFIANLNVELEYMKTHEHHHPRKDLSHAEPAPIPQQAYTGQPVTPLPDVLFVSPNETVKLEIGKDYNVSYKNNINVGNAECTIHGKGHYKGKKTVTFIIAR